MPGSDRSLWGPNVVLTDDATFEAGPGGWSVAGQASAVAQSNGTTDPACSGTRSLKITKNATGAGGGNALVVNGVTAIPVTASAVYGFELAFWTSKASVTVNVVFEWYTSGQGFISDVTMPTITCVRAQTVAAPPTDNANWTRYPLQIITSPATAAFGRVNLLMVSGLVNGDLVFMDNVFVARPLVSRAQLGISQALNRAATR